MPAIVLIRGGGDLASGVAWRLFRAGLHLIITELPQPLAVRRTVSFAEAIYAGAITIEGVTGRRATNLSDAFEISARNEIPVLVDPQASLLQQLPNRDTQRKVILIDARMIKSSPESERPPADLVIGLGPGFDAGRNCDVVIETKRGHSLGRANWQGRAEGDTGIPESVAGRNHERVLRAPTNGLLIGQAEIGDLLQVNQPVADVSGTAVLSPFTGVLRGLIHPGISVHKGLKIGDVDPRIEPQYCWLVSDKSLAVGGGVLEAIFSRSDLRGFLWD